ncbi:GNAT family N-acetyltransferase [Arenibacter sp. BSSL-BM3]|uniref:GNAT family N-acetyltransferase n=1 Tax=Arenibacter arenosicollis TaxID=2762274 RepID=A0ABR7QL14_9FLAO|nr:GNAT family N-acetyltransferase [Arenibacter arenosicollis]MBC8767804.1 GNAT family N-acetyltransferase [Arenibacter arenosicollis]
MAVQMAIETENLWLVPCNAEMLKIAIKGNKQLSKLLGAALVDQWTTFGVDALRYAMDQLSASSLEFGWWTYFPIHKLDNMLIGCGGYKGSPTKEGTVELGYEIASRYCNRGLATEMARGLILNAFADSRIKSILAHTLGESNASTRVLAKCGFVKKEEIYDMEDGLIWKWELIRP